MLHNPNWNKPANNISMDDFIGWLETKDPNETYDYHNKCGMCCIGQYMAARGIAWPKNRWEILYKEVCAKIFGRWYGDSQFVLVGSLHNRSENQTFGAVLSRTKAYRETCHA